MTASYSSLKRSFTISATLVLILTSSSLAQFKIEKTKSPNGYEYSTVTNDPLAVREYTLKNGLKIFTSINKNEPRLFTAIAVRAGSKHDPADATGLAHYLEHLLFKGTDKYGTKDFAKEKPLLDEVESLYEKHRNTKDQDARKKIYHAIDSVSGLASKWAIANEYDKMLTSLGAKGTNAFTSNEQTVYINNIPANQLAKWVKLEGERFRNPVLRLFHTELEAVYEEKNISLSNDGGLAYDSLSLALFPHHPYGTQTTIGVVDHLKNPSIKKIKDFYSTYYVPNNMGIILAGDFDPDMAVAMIDKAFGSLPAKPVPAFTFSPESPISSPIIKEVTGPEAEFALLAYRLPNETSPDYYALTMMDMVFANGKAGLIDINLNQKQAVQECGAGPRFQADYGSYQISLTPRQGQKLEESVELAKAELDKLKRGEFDEKQFSAILNDFTKRRIREGEQNESRAFRILDKFITGLPWSSDVSLIDNLSKVTKQQAVAMANKYFGNNYVVVYKRTGELAEQVKVEKPAITPIDVNRENQSPFLAEILSTPADKVSPAFLDYENDIQQATLKNGAKVYAVKNNENARFELTYLLDLGKRHDKKLAYAVQYLKFLGTTALNAEALSKRMYELGADFSVFASDEKVYVTMGGLDKNFEETSSLLEEIIATAQPDASALKKFNSTTLKSRADAKLDKNTILWGCMFPYGRYGSFNPTTNILTNDEVNALTAEELTDKIHSLMSWEHRVLYYGPRTTDNLITFLNTSHKSPAKLKPVPKNDPYSFQDTKDTKVFFINYDGMQQAEVAFLAKGKLYETHENRPIISLFNEYYGGSMSGIIFQTIRESKALAYSVFGSYSLPQEPKKPYYLISYVGTQADKISEAMKGMLELFTTMPQAQQMLDQAKASIKNKIETERITRGSILQSNENAMRFGTKSDFRKATYEQTQNMSLADLQMFFDESVKSRGYNILVLGDKSRIDMNILKNYGPVQELSLKDVFGY